MLNQLKLILLVLVLAGSNGYSFYQGVQLRSKIESDPVRAFVFNFLTGEKK